MGLFVQKQATSLGVKTMFLPQQKANEDVEYFEMDT